MKKKASSKKDQYTIVLEGIQSDFKIFGEQLSGMNDKMNTGFADVHKRLDSHQEMIGELLIGQAEMRDELKKTARQSDLLKIEKRVGE